MPKLRPSSPRAFNLSYSLTRTFAHWASQARPHAVVDHGLGVELLDDGGLLGGQVPERLIGPMTAKLCVLATGARCLIPRIWEAGRLQIRARMGATL